MQVALGRVKEKRIRPLGIKSDEMHIAQRSNGVDYRSNYLFANKLFGTKASDEAIVNSSSPSSTPETNPTQIRVSDSKLGSEKVVK